MRVQVWKGNWSVQDAKSNPQSLFLFGDNLEGRGLRGQAVIRNEVNAYGIPTKIKPTLATDAFMTDEDYSMNKIMIDLSISVLNEFLDESIYDTIVISEAGLGTGLAKLNTKAPQTFIYLKEKINAILENIQPGSSNDVKWSC